MQAGIAGAGLIGRLLAFELIQQGWQVTLFDRDNQQGLQSCGMTAAGLLAPLAEIVTAESVIFSLGLASLKRWPQILDQLDADIYFKQRGSLLLAHRQDQAELEQFVSQLTAKLASTALVEKIDHDSITQLEPELQNFNAGFHLLPEGQIDNQKLLSTLGKKLVARGVDWHEHCEVIAVNPQQIISTDDCYTFDWVFDCRGLGAKSNFKNLRGVRGEIIWLEAPEVNISRPIRLMHPRYRLYIVPRPNQLYLVGATEIESEDHSPASVKSTLELLSAAYSLHPGFAESRIIKMQTNCRPALPDNLPKIIYKQGMIAINGLYRHGFLIAPALVDQALKCLINKPCDKNNERVLEIHS